VVVRGGSGGGLTAGVGREVLTAGAKLGRVDLSISSALRASSISASMVVGGGLGGEGATKDGEGDAGGRGAGSDLRVVGGGSGELRRRFHGGRRCTWIRRKMMT
jgi:hypothetical protein